MSIMLSRDVVSGGWMADALVCGTGDYSHRVSFRARRAFAEVFRAEIVASLAPVLDALAAGASEIEDASATIQVEGLIVQRLQASRATTACGDEVAHIRFASVLGSAHLMLRDAGAFGPPIEDMTAQLYRDALNWVLLPALNLAALDHGLARSPDDDRALGLALARLGAAREQLLFQVELVKRELAWLERRDPAGRAAATPAFAQPEAPAPRHAAEPPQEEFATTRVLRSLG